jgi:hypothetical protein
MRRQHLICVSFFLLLSSISYAQLMIENTASGKVKTLKEGGFVTLTSEVTGSGISEGIKTLEGQLAAPVDPLIKILPEMEVRELYFDNGLFKETTTDYSELNGRKPMSVEVAGLTQVAYRGPGSEKWVGIGSLLTMFGGLGALVVAPLVSIDYRNGDFNKDRYYEWAGVSLAATGVGVAMLLTSSKKKYDLQQKDQAADKKRWKIVIK